MESRTDILFSVTRQVVSRLANTGGYLSASVQVQHLHPSPYGIERRTPQYRMILGTPSHSEDRALRKEE